MKSGMCLFGVQAINQMGPHLSCSSLTTCRAREGLSPSSSRHSSCVFMSGCFWCIASCNRYSNLYRTASKVSTNVTQVSQRLKNSRFRAFEPHTSWGYHMIEYVSTFISCFSPMVAFGPQNPLLDGLFYALPELNMVPHSSDCKIAHELGKLCS